MVKFLKNWFKKTTAKTKLSNSFVDTVFILIILLMLGSFAIDSYLFSNLAKLSVRLAYIPFIGVTVLSIVTIAVLTFYNGVQKRHGYIISVITILIIFKSILTWGASLALSNIGSILYFISNWLINLPISAFEKYLFLENVISQGEIFLLLISFIAIIYAIGYLFSYIIEKTSNRKKQKN